MAADERDMIRLSTKPAPNPQSEPPLVFVDNHITKVHTKFEHFQPIYSTDYGMYIEQDTKDAVPIEETSEMREQTELFRQALKAFEENHKSAKVITGLGSFSANSWNDVVQEMNRVKNDYVSTQKKGALRRFRGGMRSLSTWKAPCEQWLKASKFITLQAR